MSPSRFGIDIGGPFTDGALVDETTGEIVNVKVPTTPVDPAIGFMAAVERALQRAQIASEMIRLVVHATTVATNALIEGKTARVGMITTQGFRDVLEIGRQIRSRLYDVHLTKPRPLVSRRWSFEVRERLDAEGKVLEPLDTEAVRHAVRQLKAEDVEAIVCCFLHSYVNQAHERLAADIIQTEYPEAFLSVSSDVCPEFREYLRASTTAVNAAIMPLVSRYRDALESHLQIRGIVAPFYVMQSSGGVMSVRSAKQRPVYMVESGPAAGVIAAGAFALPHGYGNIISFDMGGTTAKVGLIRDGRPQLSTEFEVGGQAITPLGEGRGSGYPVRTPVIDLVEVGAGGGSEAWIDAGGALQVGPRSAGAVPGPVCYGQGGTEPTVTDANLALGYLNPAHLVGGAVKLDAAASRTAIADKIAAPLGMSVEAAAHGAHLIAASNMIRALKAVSSERGRDPREYALVAFGGNGPVFAAGMAEAMRIPQVLIPPSAGVFSSFGLLYAEIEYYFTRTRKRLLRALTPEELQAIIDGLEAEARARLTEDGFTAD